MCRKKKDDTAAHAKFMAKMQSSHDDLASQALDVGQGSYVNAITSNLSAAYAIGPDGKSLILDTRATDTVFHDREHFAEYTKGVSLAKSFVYTADGKPHTVEGTRVVPIRVNNGESSFIVNLQALHVP